MKKQTKYSFFFCFLLSAAFILWCAFLVYHNKKEKNPMILSIIVYDGDEVRWDSLREGAEMAAAKYKAEVRFVACTKETGWKEQIQLLERELRNGTSGFLIAAADSNALKEFFDENDFPYPYQFVETGINEHTENCMEVDNYQMGKNLANSLIQKEDSRSKIAVVMENEQRESVASRYQGFLEVMKQQNENVVIWSRTDAEKMIQTKLLLQKMLTQEAVDIVVALDNSTLEAAVDAVTNLNKECGIYGIGNSDQSVNAVDSNLCKALAYQDEFSMGYIAVTQLLGKEKSDPTIDYRIVTHDTMYLKENEKLLFPFVK